MKPLYISPIHCVRKAQNKWRFCLDLRHLNSHIDCPKFVCEGIDTVKDIIEFGDHLVTCDLSKGFLHIKVARGQEFLSFEYKYDWYIFYVLVFGLSCSPYYFHKILRPVITYLRQNYLRVSLWVDDWILMSTLSKMTDHKDLLIHTLQECGLCVNFPKSDLDPSTCKDYVGFVIDTEGPRGVPWIKIPTKKLKKLKKASNNQFEKRVFRPDYWLELQACVWL